MGSSGSKKSENKFDSQHTEPFINLYHLDHNKSYSNDISQPFDDQLQTQPLLNMPIENTFGCEQCGMVFSNDEALFKHKTRFCLGINNSSIGRKLYYSDDEEMNESTRENYLTNRSKLKKVVKHDSSIEKKREEINEWKNQRSILQNVQDMEDKILRDSQKIQKLAEDLKKRTHDYNQILAEYEQLQAQERDLLRQIFNLQGQSGSYSSQSNSLTDHERHQLEDLQRQNTRLEQERRIIQNKLEELIINDQSYTIPNYESYKLLRDMKDEQDRNEKALLYLRRRLAYPNSVLSTSSDIPFLPYISPNRRATGDGVRRTSHNGYLRSTGHDTEFPARYSDLDRRLRYYEYYPWLKDYPEPLRLYRARPIETPNDKLILAKNENQRLQNELDNMERKFEKLDSRTRQLELTAATNGVLDQNSNDYHTHPSSKSDLYYSLKSLLNETYPPQTSTNYNNEFSEKSQQYYQTSLPPLERRITPRGPQSMNLVNSNMRKLQDPLAPPTYDETSGFVMFFDFIINLPSSIDQCRLITCLHHPQSGLGKPSELQPFKCQLYVDETTGELMNVVLIATKQPVPGCPPQQSLSIVIEVQITTKQVPNEKLHTVAWTKFPLFDHRNCLLSGRWKVPLKTFPIRPDENMAVINTYPPFGRAELHYRLVNPQDAPEQSNTPLSPNLRDLYFYPLQYHNRSYM